MRREPGSADSAAEPGGAAATQQSAATHTRTSAFLLAGFERRVLPALAARLPRAVMPDHLTLLGFLAATAVGVGYYLTNRTAAWLWLVNAALVVNWFGDSLDGTLARVRRIERPRYGYYIDHSIDAYATLVIGLGLGLSPYMLMPVGLAVVIAYLLLSINVYLETNVLHEFRASYGRIGPTEVRVLLIIVNLSALFWGPVRFGPSGGGATILDVVGLGAAVGMFGMLVVRVLGNLRQLARLEPPRRG